MTDTDQGLGGAPAPRRNGPNGPVTVSRLKPGQREQIARYREEAEHDGLYIDPQRIPEGMSYEWKRIEDVFGKPDDKYQYDMTRYGWLIVPAARHPEFFGRVSNGDLPGIHKGLVLMERPKELTQDARLHDWNMAVQPVKDQTAKFKMSAHEMLPRRVTQARRNYEAVDIPVDS